MTSLDRRSRFRGLIIAAVVTGFAAGSVAAEGTFFKKKRTAAAAPAVAAPVPQTQPIEPAVQTVAQESSPEPSNGAVEAPVPPPPVAAAATPAQSISGNVDEVVSLDTLVVAGQRVRLLGVSGEGGNADALKRWIAGNGNQLTCDPVGDRYRCRNPRGADVGTVIVMNGAARTSADAPAEYRQAEMQARAQLKGIWAQR